MNLKYYKKKYENQNNIISEMGRQKKLISESSKIMIESEELKSRINVIENELIITNNKYNKLGEEYLKSKK